MYKHKNMNHSQKKKQSKETDPAGLVDKNIKTFIKSMFKEIRKNMSIIIEQIENFSRENSTEGPTFWT